MGAFESSFAVSEKEMIKKIKPSNAEWLFRHAESLNMPISEAQRCWRRFRAMGCDKKGVLTTKSLIWRNEDIFVKQVLTRLPWSKKSTLSFQAYLKICKWFSNADDITKLRVFFTFFNQGKTFNVQILQQLLKHVYPMSKPEELETLATAFVSQIDHKNQGFVDEEEFVAFAKQLPPEQLSSILSFEIIPVDVRTDESIEK